MRVYIEFIHMYIHIFFSIFIFLLTNQTYRRSIAGLLSLVSCRLSIFKKEGLESPNPTPNSMRKVVRVLNGKHHKIYYIFGKSNLIRNKWADKWTETWRRPGGDVGERDDDSSDADNRNT